MAFLMHYLNGKQYVFYYKLLCTILNFELGFSDKICGCT